MPRPQETRRDGRVDRSTGAAGGLRRRTLLAYGIGDAGTGMAAALIGFYLFVFYTQIAGLPPGWLAWC